MEGGVSQLSVEKATRVVRAVAFSHLERAVAAHRGGDVGLGVEGEPLVVDLWGKVWNGGQGCGRRLWGKVSKVNPWSCTSSLALISRYGPG